MDDTLRRYTELPYLIDFLCTKELCLLSPKTWDDRNDAYYVDLYAKRANHTAVYALCLTEASETYHHWKVFSPGSSGVCIEFDKEHLINWAGTVERLRGESVKYRTLGKMRDQPPLFEELPFLKRHAFADEMEFRLFYACSEDQIKPKRFPIDLSIVRRIVLNPWLPRSVATHVKTAIQAIEGCSTLKVHKSTLVDNQAWKELAEVGHGTETST